MTELVEDAPAKQGTRWMGRSIAQINQDNITWALAQDCVTRCHHCGWTHTGAVTAGREAHKAHRAAEHPDTFRRKRAVVRQPMSPPTLAQGETARANRAVAQTARWTVVTVPAAFREHHARTGRVPTMTAAKNNPLLPSAATAARVMGSWGAALVAAGFEATPQGRPAA